MVVSKSVEGGDCLGGVFFPIVVHKGKALDKKLWERDTEWDKGDETVSSAMILKTDFY